MSFDIEMIIRYDLFFLLSNKLGFYLPLLLSLGLVHKYALWKEMAKPQTLLIILVGILMCFHFAKYTETSYVTTSLIDGVPILNDHSFGGLYIWNYFGALYLCYEGLYVKNYGKFNAPLYFVGSFFALALGDIYFVYMKMGLWFHSGIGGAGIFDGLLVAPLFAYCVIVMLNWSIPKVVAAQEKRKINEK
jgi:hypothetical protein